MPAYNEESNIEDVVKSWYPVLDGKSTNSQIVIADTGSTDRTHEILQKMQANYPQLVLLNSERKEHGPKLVSLYNYCIKSNADYIFQTDSDGQTSPYDFDAFWEKRELYSGIFGNRCVRGDGKVRAFVEKIVCLLLKFIFGINVPDANAPFRLMKSDVLKKYLSKIPSDYNLPNIMITTFFVYYGENIKFNNITFSPRMHGKNSINLVKIFKIGWHALYDFANFKKQMQ